MTSDEQPHVLIGHPGTRLRVVCLKLEQQHGQAGGTVRLSPVTSYGGFENKDFWKWTPSGTFEFNTINPDAYCQFALGEEYYVDITPISRRQRVESELAYFEALHADLEKTGIKDGWKMDDTTKARTLEEWRKEIQTRKQQLLELGERSPGGLANG